MIPIFTISVIIILAIVGGIAAVAHRRRMSRALGRKVSKYEANSLNNWMEATDREEQQRRG